MLNIMGLKSRDMISVPLGIPDVDVLRVEQNERDDYIVTVKSTQIENWHSCRSSGSFLCPTWISHCFPCMLAMRQMKQSEAVSWTTTKSRMLPASTCFVTARTKCARKRLITAISSP